MLVRLLAASLLLLLLSMLPSGARAAPEVVASILPIHSLVAGVMAGVGEPRLLVTGGASPHGYQLKPSDGRALARAEVIVWVGEGLETFLAKPLRSLGERARIVTLTAAPGLRLLPTRAGGVWDSGNGAHGHRHGAGHGEHDPHVWLSPANAVAIVEAVRAGLSEADPPNAARYAANATAVRARIAALDAELRARLIPVAGKPYIVFHDAYRYLEDAYGLNAVGAVTVAPERPPSARRVAELRRRIEQAGASCVFTEPQQRSDRVRSLVQGTRAEVGELDPEGSTTLSPGPDAWFQLMRRLADSLVDCLS